MAFTTRLFLAGIVFSVSGGGAYYSLSDAQEALGSKDLSPRTLATEGYFNQLRALAKESDVSPASALEVPLRIALDKRACGTARSSALLSLAISDYASVVPPRDLVRLLTDLEDDERVTTSAFYLSASLLFQGEDPTEIEAGLFEILQSARYDDTRRTHSAHLLVQFGSSSHAIARVLTHTMADPMVSSSTIETLGMLLFQLVTVHHRVSADEAMNWLLSHPLPDTMSAEQKLNYYAIVGYLSDHAIYADGDQLASQTRVDLQKYFEREFVSDANSDAVRGFAATFIINRHWIRTETIQAARKILSADTASTSLRDDTIKLLNIVDKHD